MAVTKIKPIKSTLSKALDYIQNPDKTDGKTLVSSFGCSYETADIEFEYTLSQARQKGNNLAFHLIQSFEPGEVDCEKAHTIGKQLADAVTKGQHQPLSFSFPRSKSRINQGFVCPYCVTRGHKKSSVPVLLCRSEKRRLIGGAYFIFSFRRAA